jgi:hypothetical protein
LGISVSLLRMNINKKNSSPRSLISYRSRPSFSAFGS